MAALAVVLGALAAVPAEAQAQTANIEVRVILASNDGSGVDRALNSISGQLRSRFGNYNSFQQVRVERLRLTPSASRGVGLPNGSSATVSFQGMSGSSYRISVSMPGGGGTVTSPPGGIFFVAGPNHGGGRIILSLRT